MIPSDTLQGGTVDQGKTPGERIRRARTARKMSLHKLAIRMRREAIRRREPASAVHSLKSQISKWENNHIEPNEYNRHLLATVLGVTVEDLGLTADPNFIW